MKRIKTTQIGQKRSFTTSEDFVDNSSGAKADALITLREAEQFLLIAIKGDGGHTCFAGSPEMILGAIVDLLLENPKLFKKFNEIMIMEGIKRMIGKDEDNKG